MKQAAWLLCALLGMASVPAAAQFVGASDKPAVSVSDILRSPVDDQSVRLQGHLLRQTGKERYVFTDGTGEIVVEIDDDDFRGQRVDERTKVEIVGEVDTGRNRPPEIEVDTLRLVK